MPPFKRVAPVVPAPVVPPVVTPTKPASAQTVAIQAKVVGVEVLQNQISTQVRQSFVDLAFEQARSTVTVDSTSALNILKDLDAQISPQNTTKATTESATKGTTQSTAPKTLDDSSTTPAATQSTPSSGGCVMRIEGNFTSCVKTSGG